MTSLDIRHAVKAASIARHLDAAGVTHKQLLYDAGAVSAPGMEQKVAAVGALLCHQPGVTPSSAEVLYTKLANVQVWDPAYDRLLKPVYETLAHIKQANSLPLLQSLTGSGHNLMQQIMTGSHSAIAAALALAIASGSGVGALNWHLKRQTREDDQDNAELNASVREMRQQNRQMGAELGVAP